MKQQLAQSAGLERPRPSMSDETFRQFRGLIYEQTGISFQDNQKYLLESRLQGRLQERRLTSFEDYYNYLRFDPSRDKELVAVFSLVTTNETYFYRDLPQLDAFMKTVVPHLMETNKATKQCRLWSAACSTGDEAYTLALMLMEHPPLVNWSIDILATDISDAVLDFARAGVYDAHALRHVPAALLRKHFTEQKGRYALSALVKSRVKFMNLNLYDRPRLMLVRGMDAVFCRNCLIYCDDKAKQQIVTDLHAALKPNGYLIMGFSESISKQSEQFRTIHSGRSVVYQKL